MRLCKTFGRLKMFDVKEIFKFLFVAGAAVALSACVSTGDSNDEDYYSYEPFELEELQPDEYKQLALMEQQVRKAMFPREKFIRYEIAECDCSVMVPDNESMRRIEYPGGAVSYVGFIDLGMYALTLTPSGDGVNSKSADDIFVEDLATARALPDKIILYSDFELHGFSLKEISTIINSDAMKSYSVERIAQNGGALIKIEFFGILHDDMTYSYAEKFLNSLKMNAVKSL